MKQLIYRVCIGLVFFSWISCRNADPHEDALRAKQSEVEQLRNFLSAKPDSAGLRLILVNKLDSIGRYKNALLQIDTLLQKDTGSYGLWVAKANILADSGDTPGVKSALQKAISIYPGNEALLSLAELQAIDRNDSCLHIAEQFRAQQGAYGDYIKALYFYHTGNGARVDSLLDKSMLKDHYFIRPYLLKAKLLSQDNQVDRALVFYKEGLEAEPKNIALLNGIAQAYLLIKQPDSAKVYLSESLFVQPFQPKISKQLKSL